MAGTANKHQKLGTHPPLRAFQKEPTLPTPRFWTPGLQTVKKSISLCCFKPPGVCKFAVATPGNWYKLETPKNYILEIHQASQMLKARCELAWSLDWIKLISLYPNCLEATVNPLWKKIPSFQTSNHLYDSSYTTSGIQSKIPDTCEDKNVFKIKTKTRNKGLLATGQWG